MWPLLTSEVILDFIKKKLFLYYVSIYINVYEKGFLIEFARKKKAKISEFHSLRVFFVKYRRTYILNNIKVAEVVP